MSDRYVVFVEAHSHNLRHFLHQQSWAFIRHDRNTGYFETVSSRVLLELIQLDLDIRTIVAELVYVFLDLFNLAFHAFLVFFYVTPLLCPKYEEKRVADACASETNDLSCFKEVFSLFSNKLQNG